VLIDLSVKSGIIKEMRVNVKRKLERLPKRITDQSYI